MIDRRPPTTSPRSFRADGTIRSSPLILALLGLASLPADAAAPVAQRNYSVTSFDRIRVDGPYEVRLKTNVSPYARASGSSAAIDSVSVKVEGRTLIVRPSSAGWGGYPGENRGPVTIELGTYELGTAWLNGAGTLVIDKVKGLSFNLAIQGAGSARIESADVDQLRLGMSGAGSSRIAGRAASMTATVRGTSSLEAEGLSVKDAVIGAEGPAIVRATVTNAAKVDAFGLAAVTLAGKPACTVNARGSASVTGCK